MLATLAACLVCQTSPTVSDRVEALLKQLTTEEKIELLSGINSFYTKPIARVGIPQFKMSDGPAGVRTFGKTTAYPAPINMAATWDRNLLEDVGESYGRDCRARGVDFLLAPGVNIYRVPMNGRNFEYYGEDPFLAGEIDVPFIRGVQSQGVIATVKHFVANNQEHDRTGTSSDVDERTLREIYFPAFEAAVKKGGVWAVMCSYNLINGTYASANDWVLNKVLKQDWGFQGLVMSDWGATHNALGAAEGGLDLEMPGGDFFTQAGLAPLVKDGKLNPSLLDDKVRRLLRATISIGAFDRKAESVPPLDDRRSAAVALQAAREGIVLLKNSRGILPLSNPKRVAVIGPNADPAVVGGGGSSQATPFHSVSVLDAIKKRTSDVAFVLGAQSNLRQIVAATRYDGPLKMEFFPNKTLEGEAKSTSTAARIDNQWKDAPTEGIGKNDYSVRWTGKITPQANAEYEFVARGDDGYRVFVDGKPVIDEWRDQAAFESKKRIRLEKGRSYDLRVEYYQAGGDAEMRFGWGMVDPAPYRKAAEAAKSADVAIVCVGLNPSIEHEGDDRPFSLPQGQDELIQAVMAANPNTIVVLNGGGAVDMTKWVDKVPALVMAWYPGQEGNEALAQILYGEISPSGKLPISIARRWEDCAAYGNYPGVDHHVKYAEGIFVGYRHFDQGTVKPLYPFGYGLSYSSFQYSGLKVQPQGETVRVSFTIRNSGRMAADEIAQVYVTPAKAPVPRPAKELKGFARVSLKPGESQTVSVELDRRAFSYYDVNSHAWTVAPGSYGILVGASSRDVRLRGKSDMR